MGMVSLGSMKRGVSGGEFKQGFIVVSDSYVYNVHICMFIVYNALYVNSNFLCVQFYM